MLGIFLDTEANGLDFYKHRLLEIAFKIIDLSSGKEITSYDSIVYQPIEVWENSNPASLHVNGFTWDMVKNGKQEAQVAQEVKQLLETHKIKRGSSVFICQNPSFDRIFFSQLLSVDTQEKMYLPYHWLDLASMHWSTSMRKHKQENGPLPWDIGLSKNDIAHHYHIQKEGLPHRAMNGVDHLIACYKQVVGFTKSP